jgi:hypothetical protein
VIQLLCRFLVKSLSGLIILVPKERRINVSIKKNAKKVAVIVAVAFLIALAGPVFMSVALGTDSVGVISAAYIIQPVTGGTGTGVMPGGGGGSGAFPGGAGGSGAIPGGAGGSGATPGSGGGSGVVPGQ